MMVVKISQVGVVGTLLFSKFESRVETGLSIALAL